MLLGFNRKLDVAYFKEICSKFKPDTYLTFKGFESMGVQATGIGKIDPNSTWNVPDHKVWFSGDEAYGFWSGVKMFREYDERFDTTNPYSLTCGNIGEWFDLIGAEDSDEIAAYDSKGHDIEFTHYEYFGTADFYGWNTPPEIQGTFMEEDWRVENVAEDHERLYYHNSLCFSSHWGQNVFQGAVCFNVQKCLDALSEIDEKEHYYQFAWQRTMLEIGDDAVLPYLTDYELKRNGFTKEDQKRVLERDGKRW